MYMFISEKQRGFTLIELLITLALLTIVLLVSFSLYSLGMKSFALAEKHSDAKYAATRTADFITKNVRLATGVEILNSIPAAQAGYYLIYLQSGSIKYQDGTNAAVNIPASNVTFQSMNFSPNAARNKVLSFSLTATTSDINSYTLNSEIYLVNLTQDIASTPAAGSVIRFRKISVISLSLNTGTPDYTYKGTAHTFTLSSSSGKSPYTYAIASGLPSGLTLSSGVISGTPTQFGTYTFTVTVTDAAAKTASQTFTIVVYDVLSIATTSFSNGAAGISYTASLSAQGGLSPYTFSLVSGSIPNGLALASSGTISGTPAVAGPNIFMVQVSDSNGVTSNRTFTLVIM